MGRRRLVEPVEQPSVRQLTSCGHAWSWTPYCTASTTALRRAMTVPVQFNLDLPELQRPILKVWESLDDNQRQALIEKLSRLIVQAVLDESEVNNNDS